MSDSVCLFYSAGSCLVQESGWLCTSKKKTNLRTCTAYPSDSHSNVWDLLVNKIWNLKSETDFQLGHCLHAQLNRDNWTFIFFSQMNLTGISPGRPLEGKIPLLTLSLSLTLFQILTHDLQISSIRQKRGNREGERDGFGIQHCFPKMFWNKENNFLLTENYTW